MSKIPTDERAKFLEELSALTRRYCIDIGGCGCCGSPFIHHDPKNSEGHYEIDDDDDNMFFKRAQPQDDRT